jgi:DNA-binding FrmR family transcriptional regulator
MKAISQKPEVTQQKIFNRISRIEGQLKGIHRMVEEKGQCLDVITQIMAARSALSMLGVELLKADILCQKGQRVIDEEYIKKLFILQ